jgi:acetyl esterase
MDPGARVLGENVFSDAAVPDDVRRHNAAVAQAAAQEQWPPESVGQARATIVHRFAEAAGGTLYSSPLAQDERLQVDGHEVPLRVMSSGSPTGVYLWFHGSGWTVASPHLYDEQVERLVRASGLAVIGVDYRKAPEHPFPAGLDDAESAARWLIEHASERFGTDRIVIGGESAGANLAVAVLLRLRDGGIDPAVFVGANLRYGVYDATFTPSVSGPYGAGSALTKERLEWYVDQYVPDRSGRRDPEVSPLYADLSGFPPTLLTVGTHDPVLDDSVLMHLRLRSYGVDSRLDVYPGGIHAFEMAPTGIATEANATAAAFLSHAVATRPRRSSSRPRFTPG